MLLTKRVDAGWSVAALCYPTARRSRKMQLLLSAGLRGKGKHMKNRGKKEKRKESNTDK